MKARAVLLGLAFSVLFPSFSLAVFDGMNLTVSLGTGPSVVNLSWTGGQPSFKVYRATSANGLIAPGNQIGETSIRAWTDTPGPGGIFYYEITSPCVYAPPEICDGVDNDCDGTIDGPGSEASCNLPNAVPQCVGGACAIAACVSGFGDCDTSPTDGCESNLSTDPSHCGTCTVSCVDAQSCTLDSCVASSCKHIDVRTCVAAPTSGEGGLSCGGTSPAPGCWGVSCTAEVIPLPPGCANPDTDGDGLPDAWESGHAVDGNCDGDITDTGPGGLDVALPDDPDWDEVHQKNAYVYYDWMNKDPSDPLEAQHDPVDDFIGKESDGVTDAPVEGTIRRLVDAFAAVGIRLKLQKNVNPSHISPGNPTGITSPLAHQTVVSFANPIGDCATNGGTNSAVSFYQLKVQNFDLRYKYTHKYAVFGHHVQCSGDCSSAACAAEGQSLGFCTPVQENTTGLAELGGEDIIVSLGGQGLSDGSGLAEPDRTMQKEQLVKRQAATLMHELGHTFGLDHGGPKTTPGSTCDANAPSSINRKPNYISVMNYALELTAIKTADATCSTNPLPPDPPYAQIDPGAWRVDYSHGPPYPPLDESGLMENEGISGCACGQTTGPRDISVAYGGCSAIPVPIPVCGPVDWNRNGTIDPIPVVADVNQDSLDDPTKPCPFLTPLPADDDWSFVMGHLAFQCGGSFSDTAATHAFPAGSELYKEMIRKMGLEQTLSKTQADK